MKVEIQKATLRCDCGADASVTQTASAFEFDWQCVCGAAGVISWAHVNPPPTWAGPTLPPAQGTLFSSETSA